MHGISFEVKELLVNVLSYEGVIEKKVNDSTLKTFLSLLKKGRVYSFLFATFVLKISGPSPFKDDRTTIMEKIFVDFFIF